MNLPQNDYQILKLTDVFYKDYPNPSYKEINETIINLDRIKREALKFVEEYVAHMNGICKLHEREFTRRYAYSPLKYFHRELGISL